MTDKSVQRRPVCRQIPTQNLLMLGSLYESAPCLGGVEKEAVSALLRIARPKTNISRKAGTSLTLHLLRLQRLRVTVVYQTVQFAIRSLWRTYDHWLQTAVETTSRT